MRHGTRQHYGKRARHGAGHRHLAWFYAAAWPGFAPPLTGGGSVGERGGAAPFVEDHLSAWRTLARQGKLVLPEIAGAEFGAPLALLELSATPVTTPIDLIIGSAMLRLDPATSAARIAELVLALQART